MKLVRRSTVVLRLLWAIYDFIVKAYTTFALDIFSFISSIIAIYRLDIKTTKIISYLFTKRTLVWRKKKAALVATASLRM